MIYFLMYIFKYFFYIEYSIYIILYIYYMRKESFMMLAWPYPKLCWMHGLGKVLSYGHGDRPTATSAGKKDP